MRVLRASEVEIGRNDLLFRHARWTALIIWSAAFCGDAAMFYYAAIGVWKPGYIFGPALLLFLLLFRPFVIARFYPSNWLVRANQSGLFVQYRSYLNYQLPAEDASVVFIAYDEIESARLVRERVRKPDANSESGIQTQLRRFVELELAGETTP